MIRRWGPQAVLRFAPHGKLGRGLVLVAAVVSCNAVSWALLAAPSQAVVPATIVTLQLSPSTITADGTSTSIATATVGGPTGPVAGQTVVFSSDQPGDKIGPATDNLNGTYTASITSTTVGAATITAADTSALPSASGRAMLTKTPGPGPGPSPGPGPATTVNVTLSPASIGANGSSTSTATATVTDAGGQPLSGETVGFSSSDPGERVSNTTNNHDGTYTATITSSTTVGFATITATDTSVPSRPYGQSTLTQTLGAATVVNLTLSPASILSNGSSASIATATVTDASGRPLTGETVGFSSSDPGERVSSTTNNHDGTYTATITSSTTIGFATITATDTSVSPSASGRARLAQAATASTTTLMALPSTPVTNQSVTLIATATSSSSAAGPSGMMTFETRGTPISGCALVPVATFNQSATVTCQTSFSASTSPEQLTAVFISNRGSLVTDSRSATDNLVVNPDATSTALDVSNPTVKVGSSATYTATITPSHTGPVRPSGSVVFLDRGTPVGSCVNQPLVGSSSAFTVATCAVTYRKAGAHLITAHYGGDTDFSGSTSPAQPVSVRKLPVQVLGTITSTMHWTFYYTPAYTKVLAFVVNGASAGTTVLVKCRGRGCPFARRATSVTHRKLCSPQGYSCSTHEPGTVDLVRSFRRHHLSAGSRITVELTRPGLIGKSYQFKMRAGRPPRIQIRCLAHGAKGPAAGC